MPDMPEQEGLKKAERLLSLLINLLSQPERKWRTSEVAELLHVSPDTAARDLRDLNLTGHVPLTFDGKTRDFVWFISPESRPTLPPLSLGYAEGAALYAAARLLSQQHDERNDSVTSAILKLIAVLPEPLRPHLEATITKLAQPEAARTNISAVFDALSQGWLLRRVVRLHYEPQHKSPFTCDFAPYLLEPSGIGRTIYFIGASTPPGGLRTYKLERIRYAELTDTSFELLPDFDGPALLRRAWGVMYGDGECTHIKLRFSQFVNRRVRETRWHPSETVTETSEGLFWEADIGDVTEIRPWIRTWGADCEVLEPDDLREEMMAEARRLARLYEINPRRPTADDDEPDQTFLDTLFGKE
jgi:CRISPR-associated endonuclease/helicase Cas3